MNSREEGERSGGQLHLQPPRGTRSSTSRSWGARQLRLQHRNRPRIAMEGSIPGDREDQRPAAAAFHRGSATGSRSRGGRHHLLRALGKLGDLLQGLRLLPGPRQARPHRADRAVARRGRRRLAPRGGQRLSVWVPVGCLNLRGFPVKAVESRPMLRPENPCVCRGYPQRAGSMRPACHAEGRGFESLQPLVEKPRICGAFYCSERSPGQPVSRASRAERLLISSG
jgi:hypothetical protein